MIRYDWVKGLDCHARMTVLKDWIIRYDCLEGLDFQI